MEPLLAQALGKKVHRMPLTPERAERYARQIALPEIGPAGQERLMQAGVLIVGVGGLGSAAAYYLAAAGVGRLGLADSDRVELSNLQRQILHSTADLGRPKVDSARDKLAALNPEVEVETHLARVSSDHVADLVSRYDVVIAATDNRSTRYLLNEVCYARRRPLVEGAVRGFGGHLATFLPPHGPCYQCLFPRWDGSEPRPAGILGAVPGAVGALQAGEAIKIILGIGRPTTGGLLLLDALANGFTRARLAPDPSCPVCHGVAPPGGEVNAG